MTKFCSVACIFIFQNLFRSYVAYKLRNIAVVNGIRVTDSERLKGHRLFGVSASNKAMHENSNSNKREGASSSTSQYKRDVQRSIRHCNFSKTYCENLTRGSSEIEKRIKVVNVMWPGILRRIVQETMEGKERMERSVEVGNGKDDDGI